MTSGALRLPLSSLNAALADPKLQTMNFLNEVAMQFPQAISFAPGRPLEDEFDVAKSLSYINIFVEHDSFRRSVRTANAFNALGQYGRTNGVIGDLIAQLLRNDESIDVTGSDIVVTVGAQEGMLLCLNTLCSNPGDVALTVEPAYIGLSGAARLLGIPIVGVRSGADGVDLASLERAVTALASEGRRARLLYISSDFANPTGLTLPLQRRRQLLELAERLDFLVLEDCAYNYFNYDGPRLPALKSLPGGSRVIYLGSFSKTLYPGLRLGFIAADQKVVEDSSETTLADVLSAAKSLVTVNTSPVLQAVVGGTLIANNCSLLKHVQPRVAALRHNRDAMAEALERHLGSARSAGLIDWNSPSGGFFLSLTLPRPVASADLLECARDYGVTWTPMAFFHVAESPSRQIRLSFSYVNEEQIDEGVRRIAKWLNGTQKAYEHNPTIA